MQEGELVFVEDPEEFGPVEFLQAFVLLLEIDTQDSAPIAAAARAVSNS